MDGYFEKERKLTVVRMQELMLLVLAAKLVFYMDTNSEKCTDEK